MRPSEHYREAEKALAEYEQARGSLVVNFAYELQRANAHALLATVPEDPDETEVISEDVPDYVWRLLDAYAKRKPIDFLGAPVPDVVQAWLAQMMPQEPASS